MDASLCVCSLSKYTKSPHYITINVQVFSHMFDSRDFPLYSLYVHVYKMVFNFSAFLLFLLADVSCALFFDADAGNIFHNVYMKAVVRTVA